MTQENEQLTRVIEEYDRKINMANQEIERLSQTLRIKSEEINNSENRSRNLQVEIENLRRKIN